MKADLATFPTPNPKNRTLDGLPYRAGGAARACEPLNLNRERRTFPMNLAEKIIYYRRCERLDRITRQIRIRIFDYDDQGKLEKAHRIIRRIKKHNAQRDRNRISRAEDRKLNPQIY